MKLKAYDSYQKVNVQIEFNDNEVTIYDRSSQSYGTFGKIPVVFHSPDVEDYELKRWSDLVNIRAEADEEY